MGNPGVPWNLTEIENCQKKKKYETEVLARAAVKSSEQAYKTPFKFYRCRYCGRFHVARKKKNNGESVAKALTVEKR